MKLPSIIIFFLCLFLIYQLSLYIKPYEPFKSNKKYKISKKPKETNFKLAYSLCLNNNSPLCRSYAIEYEKLSSIYYKLHKQFCRDYPKRCIELGI